MLEVENLILEIDEEMSEDNSSCLAQPPQTWSDLPVPIWENVLKNLSVKDFKNFNLACKKFHEIADNYPSFQLRITEAIFDEDDAEILWTSRKLYESIKIIVNLDCVYHLNDHYNLLRTVFQRTGVFIKELILVFIDFDRFLLLELLKLLPNLTHLELNYVDHEESKTIWTTEEAVHLPKLKYIAMFNCGVEIAKTFNILKGSALEEAYLDSVPLDDFEVFVRTHEQNLKKLTLFIENFPRNFPCIGVLAKLKSLKLETLELCSEPDAKNFSVFARNCPTLKHLMLWGNIVDDLVVNAICDNFKELETLKLVNFDEMPNFENLHKLTKLRVLKIKKAHGYGDLNPLEGLALAVNENLVELEAPFCNIAPGLLAELKSNIPNLKKLHLKTSKSMVIGEVMKNFRDLEFLSIYYGLYLNDSVASILNEKVMLKLKHLRIETWFRDLDTKTARKIVNNFSNLETLTIIAGGKLPKNLRSVKILLRGLRSLKEISLSGFENSPKLNQEKILDLVRSHGKKLKKFHLDIDFTEYLVRGILMDMKGLQVVGKSLKIVI